MMLPRRLKPRIFRWPLINTYVVAFVPRSDDQPGPGYRGYLVWHHYDTWADAARALAAPASEVRP